MDYNEVCNSQSAFENNMKRNRNKNIIVYALMGSLLISFILTAVFLGDDYQAGFDSRQTTTGYINPIIDGIISEGEWERADYKIDQWVDINESASNNIDALNYMYVGQNETHVFVAKDIISKRNSSTKGEWDGLWLGTKDVEWGYNEENPFSIFAVNEFLTHIDNGTECLIYDMDNDTAFALTKEECTPTAQTYDVLESYRTLTSGQQRIDGWINPNPWSKVYVEDGQQCVISSEQESLWGDVKDHILINVSIPLTDLFTSVPEAYIQDVVDGITEMNISLNAFLVKQSYTVLGDWSYLDESEVECVKVYIENNGTVNNHTITLAEHPSWLTDTIDINASALENGYLNFSIRVFNSTMNPYIIDMWIDVLEINIEYCASFDLLYGTTSIDDFQFEYGFGVSPDCSVEHRMIEIAIPITELELYDGELLRIFNQGGGLIPDEYPIINYERWDEMLLSARNLRDSYTFTAGTDSLGEYFGGQWITYWCPKTPIWSRNMYDLTMGLAKPIVV